LLLDFKADAAIKGTSCESKMAVISMMSRV